MENIYKQIEAQALELEDIAGLTKFIDSYIASLIEVIKDEEIRKKLIVIKIEKYKDNNFIAYDILNPNSLEMKLKYVEEKLKKSHKLLDLLQKVSIKYNYFINSIKS